MKFTGSVAGSGWSRNIGSGFNPADFGTVAGEWDMTDTSTLTYQSPNSGVGAQIDNISNKANPGTLDLASTSIALSGSFGEEPELWYDMNGLLSATNLTDNTMDLFSKSVISPPFTIFQVGRVYPDDFDNSSAAQVFGGMNSNGRFQVGTDDDLDYVRAENNATVQVSTGFDKSEPFHIRVLNVTSTSSGTMTHYDSSGAQVGTTGDFDPESSGGVVAAYIRPLGILTGAGAQSLNYQLMYSEALSSENEQAVIDGILTKFRVQNSMFGVLGIGQSNVPGDNNLGTAPRQPYEGRMKVFRNNLVLEDFDYLTAVDSSSGSSLAVLDDTAQYSPFVKMMDTIARFTGKVPVAIPAAKGGTPLSTIASSRNASDPDDTTTIYGAMLTAAQSAIAAGVPLDYVWLQGGETDAANNQSITQVRASLDTIIDNLRSDLGMPNLKFSIGTPTQDLPIATFPGKAAVIEAIKFYKKENVTVVDTSDSSVFTLEGDGVHFDNPGADATGEIHGLEIINGIGLAQSPEVLHLEGYAIGSNVSSVNADLVNGQRYSFGVVFQSSVSDGQSYDVMIPGMSTMTFTVEASNLDNVIAAYAEDGKSFTFTGTTGNHDIPVTGTGGSESWEGLIVRKADDTSGIVQAWGAGAHSGEQVIIYNGALLQAFSEIYSGDRYLAYDGVPLGKVPIPSLSLQDNDNYHQSVALIEVKGGVAFFSSDHNGRLQYVWAETPAGLLTATPVEVDSSGINSTYIRVLTIGDDLYVVARANASEALGGRMYKIEDIDGSQTITTDVLFNSPVRLYPRNFELFEADNGDPLVYLGIQRRVGSAWEGFAAAVYDVNANQWYNIAGVTMGGSSLGTSGSPRWTQTLLENAVSAGTGMSLIDEITNKQVYVGGEAAVRVSEWNGSTKKFDVVTPFHVHDDSDSNSYALDSDLKLHAQSGAVSVTTADGGNPFENVRSLWYRSDFACKFVGDDVKCYILPRGRRYGGSQFFDQYEMNPYNDFGDITLLDTTITDPIGAANAAALLSAVSIDGYHEFAQNEVGNIGQYRLGAIQPRWVGNSDKRYLSLQVGQTAIHDTKISGQQWVIDTNSKSFFSSADPYALRTNVDAVNVNGVQLTSTASNMVDSSKFVLNAVFDPRDNAPFTAPMVLVRATNGGGFRFIVDFSRTEESEEFRVLGRNSSGTSVLEAISRDVVFEQLGGWKNILIDVDLTRADEDERVRVYINDVRLNLTITTATLNGVIEFDGSDFTILHRTITSGSTRPLLADIDRFFMIEDEDFDSTIPTSRRKFMDAKGKMVDLGATGTSPFATQPPFFLEIPAGSGDDFEDNRGSETVAISGSFATARASSTDHSVLMVEDYSSEDFNQAREGAATFDLNDTSKHDYFSGTLIDEVDSAQGSEYKLDQWTGQSSRAFTYSASDGGLIASSFLRLLRSSGFDFVDGSTIFLIADIESGASNGRNLLEVAGDLEIQNNGSNFDLEFEGVSVASGVSFGNTVVALRYNNSSSMQISVNGVSKTTVTPALALSEIYLGNLNAPSNVTWKYLEVYERALSNDEFEGRLLALAGDYSIAVS